MKQVQKLNKCGQLQFSEKWNKIWTICESHECVVGQNAFFAYLELTSSLSCRSWKSDCERCSECSWSSMRLLRWSSMMLFLTSISRCMFFDLTWVGWPKGIRKEMGPSLHRSLYLFKTYNDTKQMSGTINYECQEIWPPKYQEIKKIMSPEFQKSSYWLNSYNYGEKVNKK